MNVKDKALKEMDVLISEILRQLAAKEAECRQKDKNNREKDGVIRENGATIRAQQTEIQRVRDLLVVSLKVSWYTSLVYTPTLLY